MKGLDINIDDIVRRAVALDEGRRHAHLPERTTERKKAHDDDPEICAVRGVEASRDAFQSRRKVRSDTMREVLKEYRSNPRPAEVAPTPVRRDRKCPCYALRKILGCARVDLRTAVLEGDLIAAQKALDRGALAMELSREPLEADAVKEERTAALALAIKIRSLAMAELILAAGFADPNFADDETGMSLLHHAVSAGASDVVRALLNRNGILVDRRAAGGTTPLMVACEGGRANIVRMLLKSHADPELSDDCGWNALFYATYGGSLETVRIILDEGVDKQRRDKKRYRPIHWARHMGHGAVVSLLEQYRACVSTAAALN